MTPASEHPAGCDGNGRIIPREPYAAAPPCLVCADDRMREALGKLIPVRYRKRIEVPQAVADWAAGGWRESSLLLYGPIGTGKTHAAYEAIQRWCESTGKEPASRALAFEYWRSQRRAPAVVAMPSYELFDHLRPGNDELPSFMDYCKLAGLLMLDDLGVDKPSDWTLERLHGIVNNRYVNIEPMIVSSNVPPSKLAEHVGERVASRFAEMCTAVALTGSDRRKAGR